METGVAGAGPIAGHVWTIDLPKSNEERFGSVLAYVNIDVRGTLLAQHTFDGFHLVLHEQYRKYGLGRPHLATRAGAG